MLASSETGLVSSEAERSCVVELSFLAELSCAAVPSGFFSLRFQVVPRSKWRLSGALILYSWPSQWPLDRL